MKKKLHILILEDIPSDAELAQRELKTVLKNYMVKVVDTEEGFVQALKTFKPDLIISDYLLPNFDGLSALKIKQDKSPFIPFVILTGSVNEETAVKCIQEGADDYVIKEHIKRLGPAVLKALEKKKIELERKRAEDALVKSKVKLSSIFKAISDIIINYDNKGTILDVNDSVETTLGYKPKEIIGKNFVKLGLIPTRELPTLIKLFAKALKQGKVEEGHTLVDLKHKNGDLISMEISNKLLSRDNKVYGGVSVIRDITERKQAEEEVKKLSVAIQQSPVSVIITDTKGNIEYVNPKFSKLTGYSAEEVIGKNPNILKSGVNPESQYKELWNTITKGETWVGEFVNKKKNGELYWESATISPIIDDNNNITHFLAVKEDITEKKKFITDLMEREEKYRTLTQNLNVGVYRSTPGKNGIFIEANPAFLKMFEFRSKKELERWKVVDFYPDPLERKSIEEKLTSKGFLINEEVKLRKKDGTRFSASIFATAAKDESGKVIHYDGIIEDVTEEHKAREDILVYQSNLKSLTNELIIAEERTKRRLAVTLHDKLGQSLVLAKFKTDRLNKQTKNSEDKKRINEITLFIDEAINESRNITYELSPPVLYEMGLIPAISYKLDEIEKSNKIKTTIINQSKSYELEEKVQIILYRTISELLQNVIKHSKAQTAKVTIRLLKNCYRITVSDNGIGFDLEAMREKAVSQKKFGLFSIMERIRYIGGEVNINAVPNKGTKVVIELPIKN